MQPTAADPREDVEAWRLHVLIEAGYPTDLAQQLASAPVDLHQAVGLLDRGCPPATACRILL